MTTSSFTPAHRRSFLPRRFMTFLRPEPSTIDPVRLVRLNLTRKISSQSNKWSGRDARDMAQKTARRLYGSY